MDNTTATAANGWLKSYHPTPDAALTLVCCPYAGASASVFTSLSAALPASVEGLSVQYPGRSGLRSEPAISDIGQLADRIRAELLPWIQDGRPLALFGHSMGSVIAFEVARRLEAEGTAPVHLFVSGRRSPSDGLGPHTPQNDEEIVAELKDMGAIPSRLLSKPKLLQAILTVVKNDYRANFGYRAPKESTVECPITFLLADDDPYLDPDSAPGWRKHTTGKFRTAHFPGGHFFLKDQISAVVDEFLRDLQIISG
ncbi:thioesterase II family protein [Streptomyces sp. NPDC094466]|uniref:thioesterase II family protein n=1 Tax=Streptomyces sp. NPDC094466 TaxID=3366065 RepID=UPI0037F57295